MSLDPTKIILTAMFGEAARRDSDRRAAEFTRKWAEGNEAAKQVYVRHEREQELQDMQSAAYRLRNEEVGTWQTIDWRMPNGLGRVIIVTKEEWLYGFFSTKSPPRFEIQLNGWNPKWGNMRDEIAKFHRDRLISKYPREKARYMSQPLSYFDKLTGYHFEGYSPTHKVNPKYVKEEPKKDNFWKHFFMALVVFLWFCLICAAKTPG